MKLKYAPLSDAFPLVAASVLKNNPATAQVFRNIIENVRELICAEQKTKEEMKAFFTLVDPDNILSQEEYLKLASAFRKTTSLFASLIPEQGFTKDSPEILAIAEQIKQNLEFNLKYIKP